jgi:hypothetical protein
MIKVEIIKTPDSEVLGVKEFFKDKINIGIDRGDIKINDEHLIEYHLALEIFNGQLYPLLNGKLNYFHLNSKKVSGEFPLKLEDQIKIGETEMIIRDFRQESEETYIDTYKEKLKKMIDNNDPFIEKMKEIRKYIKEL